jgi:hypothetical protein
MSYAAVSGKPSPYQSGSVAFNTIGDSLPKPPPTPSIGTEICNSVTFRYTAVFAPVTCSATPWPVSQWLRNWWGGVE